MFVTILELETLEKVSYYTTQVEGQDEDLFEQFVNRYSEENKEWFDEIQFWLERIGTRIGAKKHFFRFESYRGGAASALPPPANFLEIEGLKLRLYCMRVNENNVILFNGGIKTKRKAQDCDNVRKHFLQANKISKAIHQAIVDKDIQFDKNNRLFVEDDFVLEIR